MSGVRAHLASRLRSSSLSASTPRPDSADYSPELARAATSILYRSPLPSKEGRPVYILNAAALPDSKEADFDSLLPYVLARLPEEDELLKGHDYEVVFFAGDSDGSTATKKNRPGWGWFLQAYHVLSRAMRKRLQKLYIVHEKAWVRILTEIFSTIASPKFRRKILHASTMSNLALHIPIENLLIPPSAYLHDRRVSGDIFAPYASGRRAFGAREPLPTSSNGRTRFPRVLRETTNFVLLEQNITSEGPFRVPPHAKLKEVLKEAYDRGQKYIVWKDNGVTLPIPHYAGAEQQDEIIAEVDPKDAYSVYMAAGLIKSWYADLRKPLFPHSIYRDLKRLYGDPEEPPNLERLTDLFSPASEWSSLPASSRELITRHLLPLLDAVAARQDQNKMTPENLAVCFAPALLCGPDQLEDAKTSSIIRRIFTAAIPLWSNGLREACGIDAGAFEEDLRLPKDESDWDDPVEGRITRQEAERIEEAQITGIILKDNETPSDLPPPLPPRSSPRSSQARSASGQSFNESATRRKPAPPLQVPPRYSTIITENPLDVADSPTSYSGVADGFAPHRATPWDGLNDKKSGTTRGDSIHSPIVLPKRKPLTPAQVSADAAVACGQERKQPGNRMALPGLADLSVSDPLKRKAVPSAKGSPVEVPLPPCATSDSQSPSNIDIQLSTNDFRRPSWPASANRAPNITSLARPVFPPVHPATNRPSSKSASLPVPGPKPRAPSAGLLQRMPSFEASKTPPPLARTVTPRRLNMKKASVDDLRRLYEERAGTAKTLVEAGRRT